MVHISTGLEAVQDALFIDDGVTGVGTEPKESAEFCRLEDKIV